MSPKDLVINLATQLAGKLAMPIFIVDPDGTLLFYNRSAEDILGRRFEETGEMAASIWSRIFIPTDENDLPLMPETPPLMIAITERIPAHLKFWIRSIDNIRRHIEATAFPLVNEEGRFLGAIAIFWEMSRS